MRLMEQKILEDGEILPGDVVKVSGFLNHQVDVRFLDAAAQEIYTYFKSTKPTKVLTVESSGIPLAVLVALAFGIPMVYAKKTRTSNLDGVFYIQRVKSYTRGTEYDIIVGQEYLSPADTVLLVDDFLATGNALLGLYGIVKSAGAAVAGAAIGIEKVFQGGGDRLRERGVDVYALAGVQSLEGGRIEFAHKG